MSQEQIVIRVGVDGSVSAETKGIKGPACLDSIAVLEDLLEAQVVFSEFTPDYTETAAAAVADIEVDDDLRQQ